MIQFVIDLLGKMSAIPGLRFLSNYQQELLLKVGRIEQKVGDYQTQRDDTLTALKHAKDIPKNVKGSKKRG